MVHGMGMKLTQLQVDSARGSSPGLSRFLDPGFATAFQTKEGVPQPEAENPYSRQLKNCNVTASVFFKPAIPGY